MKKPSCEVLEQEIKLTAKDACALDAVMNSSLLRPYLTSPASDPARFLSCYLDTPERHFVKHQCAFRIRKEGPVYRAAFKERGTLVDGLSCRVEHEAEVEGWLNDPGKLPPGIVRDRVLELVPEDSILQNVVTVDVLRSTSFLSIADTIVECVTDVGHVHANCRTIALCEMELELKEGSLDIMINLGAQFLDEFDLHRSSQTKHEIGMALWEA